MYKANIKRAKGRDRQQYRDKELLPSIFNCGQDNQTKGQCENKELEAQDKPSRHIQKTHFFKCTESIL